MRLTYNYLKSRIRNNKWLGKDSLLINSETLSLVKGQLDNIPAINLLKNAVSGVGLTLFSELIEEAIAITDIGVASSLLTLESCYAINRAFNSKTHNPNSYGNELLVRYSTIPSSQDLYQSILESWNETLNIPQAHAQVNEIRTQVGNIQPTINQKISSLESSFGENYITSQINQITSQINNTLNPKIKGRLRTQVSRLRRTLTEIGEPANIPNEPFNITNIDYIPPNLSPRTVDIINLFNQLASWFLSLFSFSEPVVNILKYAVSSVVCKAVNLVGAKACRYLAAGGLKAAPQLIPSVASSSGTLFSGAWAFLSAYAPYIAVVGILILAALKWSKETELGDFIYVLGMQPEREPDLAFARVTEFKEAQTRAYILQLANKMIDETRKNYDNLYAFVLDSDNQVNICLNLKNLSVPMPITDKTIITTIWESFKPFLDEFDED
ncbi:hypothetical protein [Lyngbya sp. PCC 8106]|uniref:hypothetical protein n=1 Tax=Lyngbya sp. (strain PCC 8106) TaxID=313612 RepID=UPI0000EA98AF|nr:hypothetical protein [Lyngbya sp. PCC 8106]EAW35136.1 hypothetical protein L8106_13515 [Lyngbya sp. PCC 8106]